MGFVESSVTRLAGRREYVRVGLTFKSDFHLRADENQPFFSTRFPSKSIRMLQLSEKRLYLSYQIRYCLT